MKFLIFMCAVISIFVSSVSGACESYEAEQIAQNALMKQKLSCPSFDGAKKCFVHMGYAEEYGKEKGIIAVPYFSMTDNGYLVNYGKVLIVRASCTVQGVQVSSDYRQSIRVIEAN